jgi:hypothetical protein
MDTQSKLKRDTSRAASSFVLTSGICTVCKGRTKAAYVLKIALKRNAPTFWLRFCTSCFRVYYPST